MNENSNITRSCEVCNVEVHIESYIKHIRSQKQTENEKNIDKIIPKWLFQETIDI